MKRSTNLEEEAQQLERDVDKIKLDVQDAIKKAPVGYIDTFVLDLSMKQVRI